MRFARTLAVAAATLVGTTSLATAQWSYPHTFTFQGGSGVIFHNQQVGPYKGSLDGGPTMTVFCADFYNASIARPITSYVTNLGGTDLSKTRYGWVTSALTKYRLVAYLTSQYNASNKKQWGYIQVAMWEIIDLPLPLAGHGIGGFTAAERAAIDGYKLLAQTNYRNYSYDQFQIITDATVPGRCPQQIGRSCGFQEYLVGHLTPVPEPATMGLLAVGLVALGVAGARRRPRKQ